MGKFKKGGELTKRKIVVILAILGVFLFARSAQAAEIRYKIDTLDDINSDKTNAVVDIVKHEIRLPQHMPQAADFLGEGFEYVVLTPDGVIKVDSSGNQTVVVQNSSLESPVASIAGSANYPDFIVANGGNVTHYSMADQYVANPALTSTGYTDVISLGTRELDYAVLSGTGADYYAFIGTEMVHVPALSVGDFANPLAMTLFKDHYGMAVLDGDTVKYYKNGSLTSTITGLSNAISISAADGGNLSVLTTNGARHYNLLEDGTLAYNSHLSVTGGLTSPKCVALRPGSYDRLIVDGDNINYYMWTGSSLQLNPVMSKTVEGLQNMGQYLPQATAESNVYSIGREVSDIKLYIDPALKPQQPDTSVEWYVTAQNGENWIKVNLGEWLNLGEQAGSDIRWKAVLKTTNRSYTPIINPDIVLRTNSKPNPPEIELPPINGEDACYVNASPVIHWTFSDPDNSPPTTDSQKGYQVVIYGNGSVIEDSGYIPGSTGHYVVDAGLTGKLYNSGVSTFRTEITTWDEAGVPSDPAIGYFCVIAFDRPHTEIISPQSSGFIPKGAAKTALPVSKAGTLVTVKVYSIGVNTTSFRFPYLAQQSVIVGEPKVIENIGSNYRWEISFYTDADSSVCPDGTIVNGYFAGNGRADLMYLNDTEPGAIPTNWWQWDGYRKWAEGVVQIGESAFNNWSVILQGRQTE